MELVPGPRDASEPAAAGSSTVENYDVRAYSNPTVMWAAFYDFFAIEIR